VMSCRRLKNSLHRNLVLLLIVTGIDVRIVFESQHFEVLLSHQFLIHPTLEIVFSQWTTRRVVAIVIIETLEVLNHNSLALRLVV
jgi:hypothetical protein